MQVAKNFLYNVSYQLLVIILPLITVPYVSNILGAEGIGDYAFTYANMQYFVIFGMVGITLYGNRQIAYVRDNKEKLRNTFFSIYTLQLITTTISFILYLIFVLVFNNGDYKWLYIVQGINIIASMTDISWLFMGLEQFKKTVVRNTIVKLASLASIFIFVKSSNHTVIYTLILALSALVGNLTFWLYVPKAIGFKSIKISELNLHLKASLALFIPQIAIQIYVLLDRTMLGAITDTVQVGFYENSQKIVTAKMLKSSVEKMSAHLILSFNGHIEKIRKLRNIINHYEPLLPFLMDEMDTKKIENSQLFNTLNLLYKTSDLMSPVIEETNVNVNSSNARILRILNMMYENVSLKLK